MERVLSLYRTTTQRGAGFSANPARTCADPSIELRNQARFSRANRSQATRTCIYYRFCADGASTTEISRVFSANSTDLSILPQEPARSTVFLAKLARSCTNPSISRKTWHGLLFPRISADLCGSEHLAKKLFPQSTVLSAKQARTCAEPEKLPRTRYLSGKTGADLAPRGNIPQLELLWGREVRIK